MLSHYLFFEQHESTENCDARQVSEAKFAYRNWLRGLCLAGLGRPASDSRFLSYEQNGLESFTHMSDSFGKSPVKILPS